MTRSCRGHRRTQCDWHRPCPARGWVWRSHARSIRTLMGREQRGKKGGKEKGCVGRFLPEEAESVRPSHAQFHKPPPLRTGWLGLDERGPAALTRPVQPSAIHFLRRRHTSGALIVTRSTRRVPHTTQ